MSNPDDIRGDTIAAKASHFLDVHSGAVVPDIQMSSTFARDDRYALINPANLYARDDSSAYIHAERTLADLENGEECRLFASGMAAIATIFYSLTPGNHVVLPDAMYWGAKLWIGNYCKRQDIFISEYDTADASSIEAALQGHNHTSLVWVETPSNPMMHVTDISVAADIAHANGALLCVDSTAATPVFTRPLDHGADLVVHSATKYLNGHSDLLAGAIVTRDEHSLWEQICSERKYAGAVIGAFEAWLLLRGMRTLFVRVNTAASSAMKVARFLEQHAAIESVSYPGLESHPGHEVAKKQMDGGFGGLLSFSVYGDSAAALKLAGALQIITSATSLGGVETLIEHRHSLEPAENQIPENQLRLSVGIEHAEDLIQDLRAALESI